MGVAQSPPKRGFWFYLRRVLLGILALAIVLAGVGAAYEAISANRDAQRLRRPGLLIDLGGYKLHLYCTGPAVAGDLTVILESGLAGTTSNWARIQSDISKSTRVCSYDRGGIGWSDQTPRPRDGISIARELHELLQRAGIEGELLLVGHSSGGLYARAFRALYPDRVAGLVLLDASHEDQFSRTPDGRSHYKTLSGAYTILPLAARVGLIRLSSLCDLPKEFPAVARADFRSSCSKANSWKAQQREVEGLQVSMAQVKQPKLDALPLVVVTAGNDSQNPANWLDLQGELATLSTNAKHIVRAQATHPGLLLDREDAHQSAKAIDEIASAIRRADNGFNDAGRSTSSLDVPRAANNRLEPQR